jgi:hypothetical protein
MAQWTSSIPCTRASAKDPLKYVAVLVIHVANLDIGAEFVKQGRNPASWASSNSSATSALLAQIVANIESTAVKTADSEVTIDKRRHL